MHYVALIGDVERQVEITEVAASTYQIVIDGQVSTVDARSLSNTTLSMIVDHQTYDIESEASASGQGENLLIRGQPLTVEVLDLRSLRLRRAQEVTGGPDGPVPVSAPMPGKVVDILVEEGREVEEGQGLIVVEAMKMENELRSPRAGVVRKLSVEKGVAVEGGVTLCVIE